MYATTISAIEALFASSAWTSNSIATYPADYQGSMSNKEEFVKVSILPSEGEVYAYGVKKVLKGLIIVDIFVRAGLGPRRAAAISDMLDAVFQNSSPTTSMELGVSHLEYNGLDPVNNSLATARYTINFTFYEE